MAILGLGGLGLAQTDQGRDLIGDWGVSAPVDPYTEMAFEEPDAIPTTIRDGVVPVSFTVHNVEGADRSYRWTASTHGLDKPAVAAASGRLTLADGATGRVTARVPVTCHGTRTRVDVSIGGVNRTIGFWVPCDGTRP